VYDMENYAYGPPLLCKEIFCYYICIIYFSFVHLRYILHSQPYVSRAAEAASQRPCPRDRPRVLPQWRRDHRQQYGH